LALMARPTRSSNSAWSRRPELKCSARRSATACRSASETRMCWSAEGPVNQGEKPRVQDWLYCLYCEGMMTYSVSEMCLAVAVLPGLDERAGDRLIAALVGDQQQAGQVERDARAADDGQDHERDPDDRHVDAEVAGRAGGDAREHPVLEGPAEGGAPRVETVPRFGPAVGRLGGGGFRIHCVPVHGSRVAPRAWCAHL